MTSLSYLMTIRLKILQR